MSTKPGKKGPKAPPASPKLDKEATTLEELRAHYDQKFKFMEARFDAKIDTLTKVIEKKDDVIGKLNIEIGQLQKGLSFMSTETSEIRKCAEKNKKVLETKLEKNEKEADALKQKTVDLEDRSRRCNLVFFNIPETKNNEPENCEQLIHNVLDKLDILSNEEVWIDRAHRLGRKKTQMDKPRPIIAKFCYFKQKDFIIKSASKFRNCEANVSEDFSRETLDVRRKLLDHGKKAKQTYEDPVKSLIHYKINYRRLTLTYSLNKKDSNAKRITRSFSLEDISNNKYWFMLKPTANDSTKYQVSESRNEGYQPGNTSS